MSSTSNSGAYASAAYLAALGQDPLPFGATGGHLHARPIGNTGLTDLSGPYPLFSCADWAALPGAVADLQPGPVTLTLVTDPACPMDAGALGAIFPVCRKLHDHWLIDLSQAPEPSRHHRRKLRDAGPVQIVARPATPADGPVFAALYAHLVERKRITDSRAFTAESLAAQVALPGAHLVLAQDGDRVIGADLYYLSADRAHAHLSAYAPEGYARSVSYPMMAAAIDHFAPLVRFIDLGGAPAGPAGEGIAHFKRGWTALTRPSHLCGLVCDPDAYRRLAPGADPDGWFPAYRKGEFT